MNLLKSLVFILSITLPVLLMAQDKSTRLGGQLSFVASDNLDSETGQSSGSISPYFLWQKAGRSAFGIGLNYGFASNTNSQGNSNRSNVFGANLFWRYELTTLWEGRLNIWVSPEVNAAYQNTNSLTGDDVIVSSETYRFSLGVQPGLSANIAARWRLNLSYTGLAYSVNFVQNSRSDDTEIFYNYLLRINPSNIAFGVEYQLHK